MTAAGARELESVNLVLTDSCNLRCRYCYQNAKSSRRMSWSTLKAGLDLAVGSRAPGVKIAFLGGEPLLELSLILRAVDHLSAAVPNRRFRYSVTTNGVLLDGDGLRDLVSRDIELRLSMDGVSAVQDLRGPGTFDILDRLLIQMQNEHPKYYRERVSVGITLAPAAVPQLAASVRYFLDRRVSSIGINPVATPEPGWRPERIGELDAQFAEIHRACLDHRRETGRTPLVAFRRPRAEVEVVDEDIPLCSVSDGRSVTVDVDGTLLGCTLFSTLSQQGLSKFLRDRLRPLEMGAVGEPGFEDRFRAFVAGIGESDLFGDRRTKYSPHGSCADCRFVRDCGVCPVSIGHVPGNEDPDRVPDFACAFFRTALAWRERFPALPTVDEVVSGGHAGPNVICDRASARRRSARGSKPSSL